MKRILFTALLCLVSLSAGMLQAQEVPSEVKTISVESLASVVRLSPDDHTLAVYNHFAIYDEAPSPETLPIHLFDIGTGEEIGTSSGHTDWVTELAFNSDGSQMITFHRNGDLNLWDVADLSLIKTIQTYTLGGGWVQFLPDDRTVLYRFGEYVIGMLDTETGAITRLFGPHIETYQEFTGRYTQFPDRYDFVISAAVASPDGRWLAVSTGNDVVLLWDVESGKQWTLREKSEEPARFAVRPLVFSSDSSQLTYYDQSDALLHAWDVVKRTETNTSDVGGSAFAIAPNGTAIAWADRGTRAVYLADMASSDAPVKIVELPESLQVAPNVTTLAFTSDGAQLVVGGFFASEGDNQIYVVSLAE